MTQIIDSELWLRQLTSASTYALNVSAMAYMTDIKTVVAGDGTNVYNKLLGTKSTGVYDFSSSTITFGDITTGTINGVDLAQFDTANGIVARIASGTFTNRTLTGTANQISVTNGAGVSGNPTIALANNAVVPGYAGAGLPTGTISQRSTTPSTSVKTIRGILDSSSKIYSGVEVYSDNTWQFLSMYSPDDIDLTLGTDVTFAQFLQVLQGPRNTLGYFTLTVPAGTNTLSTLDFSKISKRIQIQGVSPTALDLASVYGITGSNNAWAVTYNYSGTAPAVGNYIATSKLKGTGYPRLSGNITTTYNSANIVGSGTKFTSELATGDVIFISFSSDPANLWKSFTVSSITSDTALTATANFTAVAGTVTWDFAEAVRQGAGTVYLDTSDADRKTIIGVSTAFTTTLNVGDSVIIGNARRRVATIVSDTSLTLDYYMGFDDIPTASGSAAVYYIKSSDLLHLGCHKVTAVDTTNGRVTCLIKSYDKPNTLTNQFTSVLYTSVIQVTGSPAITVGTYSDIVLQDVIIDGNGVSPIGIFGYGGSVSLSNMAIRNFTTEGVSGQFTTLSLVTSFIDSNPVGINGIGCNIATTDVYITNNSSSGAYLQACNFNRIDGDLIFSGNDIAIFGLNSRIYMSSVWCVNSVGEGDAASYIDAGSLHLYNCQVYAQQGYFANMASRSAYTIQASTIHLPYSMYDHVYNGVIVTGTSGRVGLSRFNGLKRYGVLAYQISSIDASYSLYQGIGMATEGTAISANDSIITADSSYFGDIEYLALNGNNSRVSATGIGDFGTSVGTTTVLASRLAVIDISNNVLTSPTLSPAADTYGNGQAYINTVAA